MARRVKSPSPNNSLEDIALSRKRRGSPLCQSQRHRSAERKFQRVFNALVPFRFKAYHRSRSANDLRRQRPAEVDTQVKYASDPIKVLGKTAVSIWPLILQ